jgi:hypothetical protein
MVQQTVRFVMHTEPKASYRTVQYEYEYVYVCVYIYVCVCGMLYIRLDVILLDL